MPMKHILTLIAAMMLHVSAMAAEWTVVSTTSTAFRPEERTPNGPDDFWLHITLRNDSKIVQYIRGLPSGWYLVEAFVRSRKSGIWERQNTGYDRNLEWLAIKPGQEIKLLRRQSTADIDLPMMLTFRRTLSSGDNSGSVVLLDQFKIPAPPRES